MTFCAVGTLGNGVNKRVDILIRAIAEARTRGAGVGLLICGDGDQRADLESVTSSLGVERYVKFLGMRATSPGSWRPVMPSATLLRSSRSVSSASRPWP